MAQYKNIDIIPDSTVNRIHLSQGDIGRTLIFYLFENALSWSVPASSTIKCQGTKPSGFGFSVSCTYSGNAVTCVTTEEMTDEFGQIEAELVITSSDESQVFGTSNFILDIEKNPHPSSTEDGNIETAIALTARVEALETAVSELEANEGLTSAIKLALLQIAQKVAYIDANGQDYYDDLYDALYPPAPPATLTSISAVYTQSGTVYDTDTLDSLKSDLVVTAHYDNGTTQTVTAYTLSGTLTEGTSTITVSYNGKTTAFTVTVTHQVAYVTNGLISRWDGIDNTRNGHDGTATTWYDLVGSHDLVMNDSSLVSWENDALVFSGTKLQYLEDSNAGFGADAVTVEVVLAPADGAKTENIGWFGQTSLLRNFTLYSDNTFSCNGTSGKTFLTGVSALTDIHSISAVYDSNVATGIYRCNNVVATQGTATHSLTSNSSPNIVKVGCCNTSDNASTMYDFKGKIYAIRVYNRQLTAEELTNNYNIDVDRFGLAGA